MTVGTKLWYGPKRMSPKECPKGPCERSIQKDIQMTDLHTNTNWLTYTQTLTDWPTHKPWLIDLLTNTDWPTYTQTMTDWRTHKPWQTDVHTNHDWLHTNHDWLTHTQTLTDWPTHKPWRLWKHTVSPNTMKNLQVAFLDLLPTQGPRVMPAKTFGWPWRKICPWTTIIQPRLNIYCWTNKTWNKSKFSAVDLAKRSFHTFLLLPLIIIMMIILRSEW